MNILSKNKQIEIIAALCEGVGLRAVSAAHWHQPQDGRPPRARVGRAAPSCTTA